MTRRLSLLFIAALSVAPAAFAQRQYDRILLPVATDRVRGAFGSEWVTELTLSNTSDTPVTVLGYDRPICPTLCAAEPLPAHSTIVPSAPRSCSGIAGRILLVEHGRVADVAATLRVHDVSRQNQTWGSVVPVVSEKNLFASRFGLNDIPVDAQFRSLIRIYDVNPATPPAVRVRVYGFDPSRPYPDQQPIGADPVLFEITPSFVIGESDPLGFCPAYAEVSLPTAALAGAKRVRVEIQPLTADADYWAFATITHNETQFVTVVTPSE